MDARDIIAEFLWPGTPTTSLTAADSLLSALDAAGFVIVPKEPTLEPHNDPGITGYRLPLEPQEDGCNHEPWDQQTAMVADGMCPLCLSAKLDTLRSEVERLEGEIKWCDRTNYEHSEANRILEQERDAATSAHDDMKECLMRKLNGAREEIERLKREANYWMDEAVKKHNTLMALSPPQSAPSGESK